MSIGIDSGKTLQEQAAGVGLSWTWLGIKKTLKGEEKEKAAELWDANPEVLSLSKKIINTKNEFYSVLTKIKSRVTNLWLESSLPWVETGVRLIRKENIQSFKDECDQSAERLHDAATLLTKNWEGIKQEAKKDLGDLFCEANYPTDPTSLFGFELTWPNLNPPEYLKTIDPALYEAEKARISAAFDKALELANEAYGNELYKLVTDMVARLRPNEDGTQKKIKSTSIDSMNEFFENFKKMKVTSSAELTKLIEDAQSIMCGVDSKTLKDSTNRANVVKQFEDLGLLIETKLVPKQRRKLLLGSPELKIATQQEEVA